MKIVDKHGNEVVVSLQNILRAAEQQVRGLHEALQTPGCATLEALQAAGLTASAGRSLHTTTTDLLATLRRCLSQLQDRQNDGDMHDILDDKL